MTTASKEIEFETKLRDLLGEYGYGLRNVIDLLDPPASRRSAPVVEKATRKPRQLKVCKKNHTGERVETKGANHKTLKEWKSDYGAETVESWVS